MRIMKNIKEFETLSRLLGIDADSVMDHFNWCLQEHLVSTMSNDRNWLNEIRTKPNAIALFKDRVQNRTKYIWDHANIVRLYEEVIRSIDDHYRKPISYDDLLRLFTNAELKCAKPSCGRRPPDVVMHIDHILPASKGGSSKYDNLQFLCQDCNLRKSNKKEISKIWIKLESLQSF
jgi:hypothetical protein